MKKSLTSIALMLASMAVQCQGFSHPATVGDYIGFWRLVKIDPTYQPEQSKRNPIFQGDCQFFVHSKEGKWWHIDLKNMGGEKYTASECNKQTPDTLFAVPPSGGAESEVQWRPTESPGFFVTGRVNANSVTLWKVDAVDADVDTTQKIGVQIRAHDLLLQLWNPSTKSAAWVLILRPLR